MKAHITIVGIFYILGAVGTGLLFGGPLLREEEPELVPVVIVALTCAVSLLTAVGLIRRWRWARVFVILLSGLSLLGTLTYGHRAIESLEPVIIGVLLSQVLFVAYSLWALLHAETRALFYPLNLEGLAAVDKDLSTASVIVQP